MKKFFWFVLLLGGLALMALPVLTSCSQAAASQTADVLNTQLTNASSQLQTAKAQVADLQKQIDALKEAGQPVTPELTKLVTDATDKLTKATVVLNDALAKAQAYKAAVDAAATQPNPDAAATGATIKAGTAAVAPFVPGGWGPVVAIVGSLVGGAVAGYVGQKKKTDQATDALNRTITGIQTALVNGSLKATSNAPESVDTAFDNDNHPASTAIYEVLKAHETPTPTP